MCAAKSDVRFTPNSDRRSSVAGQFSATLAQTPVKKGNGWGLRGKGAEGDGVTQALERRDAVFPHIARLPA
jgi:hypothetical protein